MLCVLVPAALLVCLPAVAAMLLHVPTTWVCVHYLGFAGAGWAVITMRTVHLMLTAGEPVLVPVLQQSSVPRPREQTLSVFQRFWNGFHGRFLGALVLAGAKPPGLAAFELQVRTVVIQCSCA